MIHQEDLIRDDVFAVDLQTYLACHQVASNKGGRSRSPRLGKELYIRWISSSP